MKGIWPEITSVSACDWPLYGTCTMRVRVTVLKSSAVRCVDEPLPLEAKESSPGRALASAMNSFTFFTGRLGVTTSSSGELDTTVIGAKSRIGS